MNLYCPSFQQSIRLLQFALMKLLRRESKVTGNCGFLGEHISKCRNGGKSKGKREVKLVVIWNKTVRVS